MQIQLFIDPLTENWVSKLAQDETGKRQYYRPVYSLHKWWARRPGALFRAIILRANEPDKSLFTINYDGSLSRSSEYFNDHNFEDVIILDPFIGGGTTLAEANRMGAKVIGCDLNPVSYWIVRETLKPIDLKKLEGYFQQLARQAGEKIKSLYRTACLECGEKTDTLYAFWVRYVPCPHCGEDAPLFKRTLLNKGLSRNKPASPANPATAFCPRCFALNEWYGSGKTTCRVCGCAFDPQIGTYNQGVYACAHCGQQKISLIQTLHSGQKMQERLVAIEYWCYAHQARYYKSPDADDLANLKSIEEIVARDSTTLIFPKQEIPPGASSHRWRKHNYRYYHEVFNARQLLAFNYLFQAIQQIPEEEYRAAFITAFSNSLEYNNMMTPYNYPHRKLHHLFNYHAMPLTTTPVENAVWGVGKEGAGTFTNCYRRYVRAKQYCQQPFDKFKNASGKVQTVIAEKERIGARFVSSMEELLQTPKSAWLHCGDSSHLPAIPDKSVDFVITDPPYFDSIHYSELSNFFYVWLRSLVKHPCFKGLHVPTEAEAIVNTGMEKGEEEYQALLAGVFKECARVLKDDGKLIFTFHHTKWRAWWTVLMALVESGFRVAASFPVMSEYKVNPHIRNKQSLDMDLVLVCQKKAGTEQNESLTPVELLKRVAGELPPARANGGSNQLFLHFMGELLKVASAAPEKVDYDWFAESLLRFDEFAATPIP